MNIKLLLLGSPGPLPSGKYTCFSSSGLPGNVTMPGSLHCPCFHTFFVSSLFFSYSHLALVTSSLCTFVLNVSGDLQYHRSDLKSKLSFIWSFVTALLLHICNFLVLFWLQCIETFLYVLIYCMVEIVELLIYRLLDYLSLLCLAVLLLSVQKPYLYGNVVKNSWWRWQSSYMSLPESETVMGFSVQRCLSSACFVSIFSLLQVLFKRTSDAVLLVMDIKQRQSTKQNKIDYKQNNIFTNPSIQIAQILIWSALFQ